MGREELLYLVAGKNSRNWKRHEVENKTIHSTEANIAILPLV